MDSRQLEYFVAVAEELSFTRAAKRLGTVQSTLSAAVRVLETDLKTTLFDRSTRRVALTAAGQALLPEAKAALEALDRARAAVEEASTGLRGNIRIGAMSRIESVDLAKLVGVFHRKYPMVEIQVTTSPSGSSGLADDVRHGRLDVALVGLAKPGLAGLTTREIASAPFVVLVPSSHPLADQPEISLEQLAGERFVDVPTGFGYRRAVDRAFDRAGIPREVQVEVPDLATVPGYVHAGLGVAVVPDLEDTAMPGVTKLPIAGRHLTWKVSAITTANRQPSRTVEALLDLMTNSVRSGDPTS